MAYIHELFTEDMEKVLEVAKERRVCIICMEKNPEYCHRRFPTALMERRDVDGSPLLEEEQVGPMRSKDNSGKLPLALRTIMRGRMRARP